MSRTELRLVTVTDEDTAAKVVSLDRLPAADESCVESASRRVVSTADGRTPPDDAG